MRLYGIAVTDTNCRLLIKSLVADATPETLEIAQRISGGVTQHGATTALSPTERDALLRTIPKNLPNGLVPLREALARDKRARA
jgi:hypothetical protein